MAWDSFEHDVCLVGWFLKEDQGWGCGLAAKHNALAEYMGSIHSAHMVAHNHL